MGVAEAGWDSTRDFNSEGEGRWSHQAHFQVGGDGLNLHGSGGVSQNEAGEWQGDGALGVGAIGQNMEGRYSTDRPDKAGGGSGFYRHRDGALIPDADIGSPDSSGSRGLDPMSLDEL